MSIESKPQLGINVTKFEIERRFVVSHIPENLSTITPEIHTQGYTRKGLRFRQTESSTGYSYTRNRKSGDGLLRLESEASISKKDFDKQWPKTENNRIHKTRFSMPLDGTEGARIDLDIFLDANSGGIIAEVEFPSEEAAKEFVPLEWMHDDNGNINEVTRVRGWSNKSIARNGWPKCKKPNQK